MFIEERIIGVSVFATTLLVISIIILTSKRENLGRVLFSYNIILAVMAFFFVPNPGADLYRLFPIMESYSQLPINSIWEQIKISNTPFTIIYMYIIGSFKAPGLLPAITSFIFFSNVFYILRKASIYNNSSRLDNVLSLLFVMSAGIFFEVISGIRTMLAFSIICVCLYKEIVEGKAFLKNIVWYIISSLIHPVALFLTLLRLLFLVLEKNKSLTQKIMYMVILIFTGILIVFKGEQYLAFMFEKAITYFSTDSYSYLWEYIIGFISFIIVIMIQLIMLYRINKINNISVPKKLLGFSLIISLIIIISITEYNTFHRFVLLNSILAVPLIHHLLNKEFLSLRDRNLFRFILVGGSLILLMLSSTRGNLSSLKFFIF